MRRAVRFAGRFAVHMVLATVAFAGLALGGFAVGVAIYEVSQKFGVLGFVAIIGFVAALVVAWIVTREEMQR